MFSKIFAAGILGLFLFGATACMHGGHHGCKCGQTEHKCDGSCKDGACALEKKESK